MRIARIFSLLLTVASPALALSNRVFVSSTGMDVGTCPITAPCRSFSYGMTQVVAGGEMIALDTAGYGAFTINQSVTVFAPNGVTAFIAATSSATGILITAGSSDVIVLRGLALTSNVGNNGIDFEGGSSLAVENCIINGFPNYGITMARSEAGTVRLRIQNSTIRNNFSAIRVLNTGIAGLTISNSSISENGGGLDAFDNTRAAVTDTVISGNSTGVFAGSVAMNSAPEVTLERCTIAQNSMVGIDASSQALVRIAHDLITGNALGVKEENGGIIATMHAGADTTNTIAGNATDGSLSGSYSAK